MLRVFAEAKGGRANSPVGQQTTGNNGRFQSGAGRIAGYI